MVYDTLVPYQGSAGLIAYPALEVLALGDMIKEELEEVVRLLLVEANDAPSVHRVHALFMVLDLALNARDVCG